ncbi:hypothetical protein U9M48_004729 [Paspalum notatum var. saurae]|uniref:Uncharacterized protein n=1 Tax=Paspalum notatum var. saurae TaxID=547442 RepID=A0AAQ3PNK1_PASNO
MRLHESTDVVGVAVTCLQQFTPRHFRPVAEDVEIRLTRLPTQDLCWVPSDESNHHKEHWDILHTIFCKWFWPNPFCCRRQLAAAHGHRSSSSSESFLPCGGGGTYLEPVTHVYLQGHIPWPAAIDGDDAACPARGLKFGVLFSPHASSKDLTSPAVGGSETEMIDGDASDRGLYANISFRQMGEIMLPKAAECLRRNTEEGSWNSDREWGLENTIGLSLSTRKERAAGNRLKRQASFVSGGQHLLFLLQPFLT